jgi:hypothetical protein
MRAMSKPSPALSSRPESMRGRDRRQRVARARAWESPRALFRAMADALEDILRAERRGV